MQQHVRGHLVLSTEGQRLAGDMATHPPTVKAACEHLRATVHRPYLCGNATLPALGCIWRSGVLMLLSR